MKNTFAQSMAWLHTWSGLVIGWLLFVIFVGGTIACFDTELDRWMRPEMAVQAPARPAMDAVAQGLAKTDPAAHAWYLYLPSDRYPAIKAGAYYEEDGRFEIHSFDAATGAKLRDTAGGDFFFELHYNLHAGTIGMYLVGLAGMMMLVAMVTGIVIHKRIFKDFFLLRFGRGQRAWLDGHNVTGVLGLPFHLMIAYTGVAIFVTSYMSAGLQVGYKGDIEKLFDELAPHPHRAEVHRPPTTRAPLQPMIDDARARLGGQPWLIAVEHPNDASHLVAVGLDHSRHLRWNDRTAYYDGVTGAFVERSPPARDAYKAYTTLGGLHMVQFGGALYRWLYFVLGLAGCVMLACGLQVWVEKRAKQVAAAGVASGYGFVRAMNVGVVAGMPLASVAMLWANRLLPPDIALRATQEIRVFCAVWVVAALWSWLRLANGRPWRDLFAVTALLCLGLPLLSMAVTPAASLLHTFADGSRALAAVDLTLVAMGVAFAWLAVRANGVASSMDGDALDRTVDPGDEARDSPGVAAQGSA